MKLKTELKKYIKFIIYIYIKYEENTVSKIGVDDELEIKKQEYLKSLQMSKTEIQRLERDTINQQKEYYEKIRGKNLPSSYFGHVCRLTPISSKNKLLIKCLSTYDTVAEDSNAGTSSIGYTFKSINKF